MIVNNFDDFETDQRHSCHICSGDVGSGFPGPALAKRTNSALWDVKIDVEQF